MNDESQSTTYNYIYRITSSLQRLHILEYILLRFNNMSHIHTVKHQK